MAYNVLGNGHGRLTGTAAEVTPVGQIGEHTFEVGKLTREIAESYEKLVRE